MCEITHNFISEKKDWRNKLSQTKINLKTVHLDEQNNDLYKFSYGNTPCVVGKSKKGFKLIFSDKDLDNFDGDVEFFFKSLENKINEMFLSWNSLSEISPLVSNSPTLLIVYSYLT